MVKAVVKAILKREKDLYHSFLLMKEIGQIKKQKRNDITKLRYGRV